MNIKCDWIFKLKNMVMNAILLGVFLGVVCVAVIGLCILIVGTLVGADPNPALFVLAILTAVGAMFGIGRTAPTYIKAYETLYDKLKQLDKEE